MISCRLLEHSSAHPVDRHAMTSEWSPKIDSACVATARAAMWNTVGVSSPAILYMLGIISSRPCEAVNVVDRAPVVSAPCTAPAAPASDCISTTDGTVPQMFFVPSADISSAFSPIVEDGVIGIDRDHLVGRVRDVGRGGVPVDGYHLPGHECALLSESDVEYRSILPKSSMGSGRWDSRGETAARIARRSAAVAADAEPSSRSRLSADR